VSGATYVGPGMTPGVPSRDLDSKEWEKLPEEVRKQALESGTHKASASPSPRARPVPATGEEVKPNE